MGRQRTVNDAEFWRSPRVADRTQEDKATLLYLLTSPYSNIIGVYQIVPRIAAAEMGWTADQLVTILKRLVESKLIFYDPKSGFVWVKIWWDHNSAKMAVATTLRSNTLKQIDNIPIDWRDKYLEDFLPRLAPKENKPGQVDSNLQKQFEDALASHGYRVSIPYGQGIHSPAGNTNSNINSISNTNTNPEPPTTSNLIWDFPSLEASAMSKLQQVILQLPPGIQQDALDEISAKMKAGTVRSPIALARYFASHPSSFCLTEGHTARLDREKRARVKAELKAQAQRHVDELAQLDENLVELSEEQLLKAHQNLPEGIVRRLLDRRAQLTSPISGETEDG